MSSIRLVRPRRDNKIRNFSRAASDNDILHFQRSKQRFIPPSDIVVSAENSMNTVMAPGRTTNGIPAPCGDCSSSNLALDVVDLKHVINNAFEIKVKNMKTNILENKHFNKSKNRGDRTCEYEKGSILTSSAKSNPGDDLFDVKDEELEKIPEVDFPRGSNITRTKVPHSVSISSKSDADNENSLSDVKDEDLGPLPSLGTPSRILRAKSDKNFLQQRNDTPDSPVVNRKLSRLKRSVSSIESDEDFTSFFGTIKNPERRRVNDHLEEEQIYDEPFYLNTYASLLSWHPNTPTEAGLNLNRAYSAESFMKKKDYDEAMSDIYSHSRKSSSLYGEGIMSDGSSSSTDRLQMRRGALAEPEKMLISQEIRERAQKDVERRKTFLRKVSQFFNVHLHLNREEDLI